MQAISILPVACGLLLLPFLISSQPRPDSELPKGGRYIGAAMCKNCHNGADKGDQYDHWSKEPHAKAYETLATPAAKAAAKELGIADPQQSEKCLKCHVTAYGVAAKEIKASFKVEHGVQCEACHGPGEEHQKLRFKEAMKKGTPPSPIGPDEIVSERSAEICTKCHNQESPTYKPFCLKERMKSIEHLDPRKQRTKEELKKLRETCSPECKVCGDKAEASAKKEGDGK